jgi:hypothetical protein
MTTSQDTISDVSRRGQGAFAVVQFWAVSRSSLGRCRLRTRKVVEEVIDNLSTLPSRGAGDPATVR